MTRPSPPWPRASLAPLLMAPSSSTTRWEGSRTRAPTPRARAGASNGGLLEGDAGQGLRDLLARRLDELAQPLSQRWRAHAHEGADLRLRHAVDEVVDGGLGC